MIFRTKNKTCDRCAHFQSEWDRAGLCSKLGVLARRNEYIVDGIEIFNMLNVDRIEYRNPVVRNKFNCIYWKEK